MLVRDLIAALEHCLVQLLPSSQIPKRRHAGDGGWVGRTPLRAGLDRGHDRESRPSTWPSWVLQAESDRINAYPFAVGGLWSGWGFPCCGGTHFAGQCSGWVRLAGRYSGFLPALSPNPPKDTDGRREDSGRG